MTLTELRNRLRAELGDETAGAYLWSDTLLNGFLGDAVERLGEDAPLQRTATLAPAGGAYTLPADLLRLRAVEIDGVTLAGDEYSAWGGKLTLTSPTTRSATVRYGAARARPPTTGDIGLLAAEEPPVLWLAASYAMSWLAKQREKIGPSAVSTGASAVAHAYVGRYDRWLTARRRPLRRITVR